MATRLVVRFVRAGVLVFCFSVIAAAQSTTPAPSQPAAAGDDSDPTRPVAWSLREEFYNLPQQPWNNAFLFRVDRAFLPEHSRIAGKNGILARVDIPLVVAGRPDGTFGGLGDIYAQALRVPVLTRRFAFAAGSGITVPTATDGHLGNGKLLIAPVAIPVWLIPQRGFFFIKVQDYVTVAGADDRPDLHYLTITPLLLWRLKDRPYWMQFDGETQTDWNEGGHTGYKAGLLFGRMLPNRRGAWIKVEVGMGAYRVATFAIKASVFKVR